MIFYAVLAYFVFALAEGGQNYEEYNKPQPYSFGYVIKDKEGVQHRDETGDGVGTAKGSYGFYDNKGIRREVEYVADNGGFKARIRTNEPGTSNQDPASVLLFSNDPYAQGAGVPYNSRPNVPYVAALYTADGKTGFPTVYDFHKFSIDEPYVKELAYGPNYNGGGVVYFGANYDGGIITGYNSLFTAQAG